MERSESLKRAYPWLILVSCCLLQGAGLGIMSNCTGLFYVPVMEEFGVSMASVSLYVTINNIFQCIGTLFVTRVIRRFKVKYLIPLSGIVVGLAQMSLAFSRSIVHWYVCAVIQGFIIVYVTGILIPLAVTNWFSERTGFALGMTSMSAGLFGALLSAFLGVMIARYSWRTAIFISGIAIIVMTVPMQWFVMVLDPREKGCVPFGGFREEKEEVSSGKGVPFDLRFISIVMIASCASFSTIFNNSLPAYGLFRGITLVAPAFLLSLNMFGNMGFKLGFGALNDYIGAKRTTILSYVLLAVASYVLIVGSQILVCFASFLFGINALIATTQTPLLSRDVYTKSEYPVALQVAQISVRLSYALFAVVEGALFDMWGEFRPLLVLQVVVCAIGLAFVFLLYSRRRRKA